MVYRVAAAAAGAHRHRSAPPTASEIAAANRFRAAAAAKRRENEAKQLYSTKWYGYRESLPPGGRFKLTSTGSFKRTGASQEKFWGK